METHQKSTRQWLAFLFLTVSLGAQTPMDAIMMKGNQICFLFEYNYGSFDQYWEGAFLRENQTIATVRRNVAMPMAAIGIFDRLNLYLGMPHIETESAQPNGGKFAGVNGIQDLLVALKYQFVEKVKDSTHFSAFATLGFSTPVTNYLPDYMPYSIGLGAPELSYRAIAQYTWKKSHYVRGAASYLWRGYAEAEREYYYNNGSFYTPWMDVPNAVVINVVLGTWAFDRALQMELNYMASKSTSGDDIRAYNAAQPTNNVDMDWAGIQARYFFPKLQGLGLVAYHNRVVYGRNAPKMNVTGLGLTYFFNYR